MCYTKVGVFRVFKQAHWSLGFAFTLPSLCPTLREYWLVCCQSCLFWILSLSLAKGVGRWGQLETDIWCIMHWYDRTPVCAFENTSLWVHLRVQLMLRDKHWSSLRWNTLLLGTASTRVSGTTALWVGVEQYRVSSRPQAQGGVGGRALGFGWRQRGGWSTTLLKLEPSGWPCKPAASRGCSALARGAAVTVHTCNAVQ